MVMVIQRATLDNSSESLFHLLWRHMSIRDFRVAKAKGYAVYDWTEVVKHDKPHDCWIVVHGKVYDVTEWVPHHPGGQMIWDGAGGDCTGVWESYHPLSVLDSGIPDKYLIGEVYEYRDFYSWDGSFYRTIKERVEAQMPASKRRDDPKMVLKSIILLTLYLPFVAMYIYFCTWWSAVLIGLLCGQIGVNIMHDGNHGAYSSSKLANSLAGYTLDLVGSCSVVYRRSHNFGHHSCVNHYELDRAFDTSYPYLRLHVNQQRLSVHQYQHLYAWLVYALINFGDFFGTIDEMFWMSNFPNRRGFTSFSSFALQLFVKVWTFFVTLFLPTYVHGFLQVFWIWFFMQMVFSIGYSLFFAVNHWTLDAGFVDNSSIGKSNWGVLQVENSLNFGLDSKVWTHLSGGLNHQIEHHLFPGMVHTRLPEITGVVQRTCQEFGLRYYQYSSFWTALKGHYRLLKTLGCMDQPPSPVS